MPIRKGRKTGMTVRFVSVSVVPVVEQGESTLPDVYGLTAEGRVYVYSEVDEGWQALPMEEVEG